MYEALKERFAEVFGAAPTLLFSAPGRAELCGNHTDHPRLTAVGESGLETC